MFLILSMATSAHGALAGTWSLPGSMSTAREGHTATLLSDGRVLVSGGDDNVVVFASEVSNETLGRERLRLIAYGNKPAAVQRIGAKSGEGANEMPYQAEIVANEV